jgi:DNA-binding CsgD family transcriptional regulator
MGGARKSSSRRAGKGARTTIASALGSELRDRFALTRMEAVVACALADGLTYEEIAYRCSISYHTVHSHVKAIHQKAGVSSNGKLLALIRREGWR